MTKRFNFTGNQTFKSLPRFFFNRVMINHDDEYPYFRPQVFEIMVQPTIRKSPCALLRNLDHDLEYLLHQMEQYVRYVKEAVQEKPIKDFKDVQKLLYEWIKLKRKSGKLTNGEYIEELWHDINRM